MSQPLAQLYYKHTNKNYKTNYIYTVYINCHYTSYTSQYRVDYIEKLQKNIIYYIS